MKRFLSIFLLLSVLMSPVWADDINFKSHKRKRNLLFTRNFPKAYKPTRIILGKKNKFLIQAEAGSYVSLATSFKNKGADLFYGKKLRLGEDLKTTEGIIPPKGVLEVELEISEDKKLEGKMLFFEVAVWKNPDFSDLKLAKIMAANGRESQNNAVVMIPPEKKSKIPLLGPALPGTNTDFLRTINTVNQMNEGQPEAYEGAVENSMFYNNQAPLMLRNLRDPSIDKKKK